MLSARAKRKSAKPFQADGSALSLLFKKMRESFAVSHFH